MWIKRDISSAVSENSDPIQVVRGPRQCGKTSLILHLGQDFQEISLDDPVLRALAQSDPELLLKQYANQKLFIDEAQYAPELFPSLKRRVDLEKRDRSKKRQTLVRLTGSNQILMDRNIKESLAGRASFFDMNTLSVSEILESRQLAVQEILFQGGWPEVYAGEITSPRKYLDGYISSYIEKDVVLAGGIQKSREFLKLVRMLAGRVGQLLDFSGLSNDVGVDAKTVREWISLLEKMHIVALVPPYFTNLSNRLIKTPKLYFIDTGLACRLQGWTSSAPILTSPQQGHLFENLVFSEVYKFNINHQLGWQIFHWRSKDREEIDFLIQLEDARFLFIEAKVSFQKMADISEYPQVRKVFKSKCPPYIQCHQEGERVLDRHVPIALLADFLRKR